MQITVQSLKYDRKPRRTWTCELLEQSGGLIYAAGVFEEAVSHAGLGNIKRGTVSHEYYWTDRWYNVFRFHEPDGSFRNYYCNIAMPAEFRGKVLQYVDLDMDVIVWSDGRHEIHDRDDFDRNSIKYGYTDEIKDKVEESLSELLTVVETRQFPFDASY
jgi:protein associated with RNAse G/E